MPTAPEQTKLKEGAGGFASDLAKQSAGNVTLTNQQLAESGASAWGDYAKQTIRSAGAPVVTP